MEKNTEVYRRWSNGKQNHSYFLVSRWNERLATSDWMLNLSCPIASADVAVQFGNNKWASHDKNSNKYFFLSTRWVGLEKRP